MSRNESSPVRLVVSGATGRMGRTVARLAAADPAFEVVGGLDRPGAEPPEGWLPAGKAAGAAGHTAGGADSTGSPTSSGSPTSTGSPISAGSPPSAGSAGSTPAASPTSSPAPTLATLDTAGLLLSRADVVIDFSAPEFIRQLVERYVAGSTAGGTTGEGAAEGALRTPADARREAPALVIGTTGLGPEIESLLDEAARRVPVLTAANFSVGVNLLLALAERAASTLGPEFDIEIVEAHHRRKEDAPSGTALALGKAVAAGRGVDLDRVRRDGRSGRPGARPEGEIGFHAIRGGDVIGEHHVLFLGELERVELVHRASDRGLFAAGALRAARWIRGRPPGRYSMRDVLGF